LSKPVQSILDYSGAHALLFDNNSSALKYIYPASNLTNAEGKYYFSIRSPQP
jgi:hypothetical protein